MNELTINDNKDTWDLIKRTLMDTDKVKYTEDELKLFMYQAKRTGLDPMTRQIYCTKRDNKMTVQATIDGLRLIAQRSGEYEGQTRATWFDKDGKEYKVWTKEKEMPYACEIGVYKKGFKEPVYAIAIFNEYAQRSYGKLGYMWEKMPALMIAKVAEALALRKAFPNDLSGIYSTEEIPEETQTEITPPSAANKPILRTLSEVNSIPSKLSTRDEVVKPLKNHAPQTQKEAAAIPSKFATRDVVASLYAIGRAKKYADDEIKKVILNTSGAKSMSEVPTMAVGVIKAYLESNEPGVLK